MALLPTMLHHRRTGRLMHAENPERHVPLRRDFEADCALTVPKAIRRLVWTVL